MIRLFTFASITLVILCCSSPPFNLTDSLEAAHSYTVSYNPNGGIGSVPVDSNHYYQGGDVTVQGNTGNLSQTGHTFAGWNTSADGSGSSYVAGAIFIMGSANVTLYAEWTQF